MNISINATKYQLAGGTRSAIEKKLAAVERLLGDAADTALLEIELEEAPAEGRSATPTKLVAVLKVGGRVYHAEAVKPSAEIAADRVRATLEAEIRHSRGKGRGAMRRGASRLKDMLRFGR